MTTCCIQTFLQYLMLCGDLTLLTGSVLFIPGRSPGFAVIGQAPSCSEAIDAFTVSWSDENNWLFPPPCLIPRVLQHLKFVKSESKLVVPYWSLAPWWPLLVTCEGSFQHEIVDFMIIMPRENLFIPAVLGLSMFSSNIPRFYLLALRFCFCMNFAFA